MNEIILITFESGMIAYIPRNNNALEFIVVHFDSITDIQFISYGGDL